MRRFTDDRLLYMALSLAIAAVMWLYVANSQGPGVEKVMSVDLHVRGLGSAEVVVQVPNRISIRLQGPPSALTPLEPNLLDASVDLTGLGPGTHHLPVYVAMPPDVRTIGRPEAVVVLDRLVSERVPVEVGVIGQPPEGITLGSPQVSPGYVRVSGAATQLDEVRHAIVTVDSTNLRQQLVTSVSVRLVDANGREVHGLSVTPPVVETRLAVKETVITKVVPVVQTIAGTPSSGLAVTGVTSDPATVTLSGPAPVLAGIQSAPTAPVELAGARADVTRQVPLVLPDKVTASVPRVKVVVHIGHSVLSTLFRAVPVRVVGVPAGTKSRVVPDRVDVQVEGPQDILARLKVTTLIVEANAAGQHAGQHQVTLRPVLPPGVRIVDIRPSHVVVILTPS
jgi:YbbR domain-containing protein